LTALTGYLAADLLVLDGGTLDAGIITNCTILFAGKSIVLTSVAAVRLALSGPNAFALIQTPPDQPYTGTTIPTAISGTLLDVEAGARLHLDSALTWTGVLHVTTNYLDEKSAASAYDAVSAAGTWANDRTLTPAKLDATFALGGFGGVAYGTADSMMVKIPSPPA
jgi:hypothetical protein